ncbi:MAG: DUF87 domain-containing protein [Saprospiraceae bacterium]
MIDFETIYRLTGLPDQDKDKSYVTIGKKLQVDLSEILQEWTFIIDHLLNYLDPKDIDVFTKEQLDLWQYRLISYEDYGTLFQKFGDPKEVFDYPACAWLDIVTLTELYSVTHGFSFTKADYLRFIRKHCPKELMNFFENKMQSQAKLSVEDLEIGTVISGGTGWGKTTLLSNIVFELMKSKPRDSAVILDPHGHLGSIVGRLKAFEDRLMYFTLNNFEANQQIFSYNVFESKVKSILEISERIDNVVEAISELPTHEGHEISANMKVVLTYCLKFLYNEVENPTLVDLYNLLGLEDTIYKKARAYDEYFIKRFSESEKMSRMASQRRVENAILKDLSKEILCHDSTFNLEEGVNSNKIMVFDLSQLGSAEAGVAMGKFLIANIKNIVRKRDPNALENRTYLVIDEAPVFIGDGNAYEVILSQMRKFGLHTMLVCQYPAQFGPSLETIKHNTAIKIYAAEFKKDVAGLDDVPSIYLRKSYDGEQSNTIELDRYEYLVKTRGKATFKFKASDELVNNTGLFMTVEDQINFLKDQYAKYYRPFQKEETPAPQILKLAPVKVIGEPLVDVPPIQAIHENKEKALLYALATYKFLTVQQMLTLGISKFASGLPTAKLKKSEYILSVSCQLEGENQTSIKVFFLTKKGAKFIDSDSEQLIKPNFPSRKVTASNMDHKLLVIDAQIELSRFDLKYVLKDIDNSGTRNVKCTRISWDGKWLEPDILFAIGEHYFTLEVERLLNTGKSFQKIQQHLEMIAAQAYQKQYNFNKEHVSLWVFEEESTMKGVMERCCQLEFFPIENFRFKLSADPIYDSWVNCKNEKRCLYYL